MVADDDGGTGAWVRTPTRKDLHYLQWAMAGAELFSTCSRKQYMAIIVGPNGRVVGTGYNGGPPGTVHCVDGGCPRATRDEADRDEGYADCIAIHAEANAIAWTDPTARWGSTLYVTGEPCWNCAKLILGSGVTAVVYALEGGRRSQGVEYLAANGLTMVGVDL